MNSNDLNDPLDDLLKSPVSSRPAKTPPASYQPPSFTERCPRCAGSGTYGRFGRCFKCKGTGKLSFRTSSEHRRSQRASRQAKVIRTAQENLEAFKISHPEVFAWFENSTFPFAIAMRDAVGRYGDLTEKQMAASLASIEKLAAARQAGQARVDSAKSIDLTKIDAAFARAGAKLRKPKLRVAGLTIYPAKADSANAGALYVRGEGVYLGKIKGGKFIRSRECSTEIEQKIHEVAADPKGAAVAYGQLTGNCACCGRALSNAESVALGIGPICAETFGWGA